MKKWRRNKKFSTFCAIKDIVILEKTHFRWIHYKGLVITVKSLLYRFKTVYI